MIASAPPKSPYSGNFFIISSALGLEFNRQKRDLIAQKQAISSQLSNKYSVINTMVSLAGKDYTVARDEYEFEFNQAISVANLIRGINKDEQTAEDKQIDNARANLQVLYNTFASGEVNPTQLDEAQRASITKMELEAGFPQGFFSTITPKDVNDKLLSTSVRVDKDGNKFADMVFRNEGTGEIYTINEFQGTTTVKPTPDDPTDLFTDKDIPGDIRTSIIEDLNDQSYAQTVGELTLQTLAQIYPEVELGTLQSLMDQFYDFGALQKAIKEGDDTGDGGGKRWWQFWKK